ncbi:actin-like ATPase domain-containing protein [Backusella circina FSU 941]|nr:actin-like ATPase domain-containing protein [Backusella circina FSU 941]
MVPYFDGNDEKLRHKVRVTEGQSSHSQSPGDVKTIDFSDVDYVIGLDFGTTYSGFAYAKTKHCNDPTVKHINVVKNDGNFSKAPSMLYYKDKKKVKFGTEAKIAHEKPKSSGVLLRHFKLLLSRDFNPKLDDTVMKRLNDLEIIDAIKDYLSAFNKKGLDILKEYERIHTKVNVGYIITIPSMWCDEAKNTMRVAVQKAGLVSEKDINTKVHFITEAEAAAMYCEKFYDNQFSMERDQRFMICDAGGGTVDLVTFKVSQEKKNGNKFIISELTSGDGDNFGSVFLDAAFEEYIINKFTENKINICQSGIRSIVAHFINDIKPNFEHAINPDMIDDYEIQIPSGIDIPHELSIPGFIENGSICIPYAKIEKEVFTPVIKDVLNLIKDQLEKLNENERQLDAILLVGGFGQSPYLYRRIYDTFENKAIGARFIGRPPNGQLAICKGAVSFGLQPRMVSEGFTRYSYGLQVKDRFQDSHDDPEQKIDGYDGNKYCQNVFSTIIEKDATLKKGHVYIKKVHVTYPNDPVFGMFQFI